MKESSAKVVGIQKTNNQIHYLEEVMVTPKESGRKGVLSNWGRKPVVEMAIMMN
jgi:hypothetical protein